MKIYLAGSVPKGDKEAEGFVDWRKEYAQKLKEHLPDADFIDPNHRNLDENEYLKILGNDCLHIKQSDLTIVNAESSLGAGTAQEIVIAKYFTKPVITVLPKDTKHRRTNIVFHKRMIKDWIHPFIAAFSDKIVEAVSEIDKEVIEIEKIKDISIIDDAIKYYETHR